MKGQPRRYLHGHHLRGRSPGSYVNAFGYRMTWMPDHPAAQKGYVLEHRHVMEQKLGRPIDPSEPVHHVNHDKLDNRPENLELLDRHEHGRKHGRPAGQETSPAHRRALSEAARRAWAALTPEERIGRQRGLRS